VKVPCAPEPLACMRPRDHFAGEMRQLFDQPDILQQSRTARPGRLDVEIVRDRRARCMGQRRSIGWSFIGWLLCHMVEWIITVVDGPVP